MGAKNIATLQREATLIDRRRLCIAHVAARVVADAVDLRNLPGRDARRQAFREQMCLRRGTQQVARPVTLRLRGRTEEQQRCRLLPADEHHAVDPALAEPQDIG